MKRFFLFLLLFNLCSVSLLAQNNCGTRLFQVAEKGWISASVMLNTKKDNQVSLRFTLSEKGLFATLTSQSSLNITKGDNFVFINYKGDKIALPFINQTSTISYEGHDHFVNSLMVDRKNLKWLSIFKTKDFAILSPSLNDIICSGKQINPNAGKEILLIFNCLHKYAQENIFPLPLRSDVDTLALRNAKVTDELTDEKVLDLIRIYLKPDQNINPFSGVDQPGYAHKLSQIAELLQSSGKNKKAEELFLEAQQNIVQFSGVDYDNYPNLLNDLATFYRKAGDFSKAKKHYKEAKDLIEKVFGKRHPDYPITLNNLGSLHLVLEEFENSESNHYQAKEILEKEFSTTHPEYSNTLIHLTNYHRVKKEYSKALELLTDLSRNIIHQLYSYYPSLNDSERLEFLKKMNNSVHQFYSSAIHILPEMPEISNEVANISLAVKGLVLEGSISARAALLTSGDSTLRDKFYNWLGVRRQLVQASLMPSIERDMFGLNIEKLDNRALNLEKELSAASDALANQFKLRRMQLNVDSVRAKLKKDEIAVDFIHFLYHDGKDWLDSTLYYALLIKKNQPSPLLIPLCNHSQLQEILSINITQKSMSYINNSATNRKLYDLIFKPLVPSLDSVSKIYISPSGLLHQIAFPALLNEENQHLLNCFDIVNFGSFRDFVYPKNTDNDTRDIVLAGGAKFSVDSVSLVRLMHKMKDTSQSVNSYDLYAYANTALPFSRALASNFSRGNLFFSYLEGTKKEVDGIENFLIKKNWITHKYTGEEALEDKVKMHTAAHAPFVLHIATHGYFFKPLMPGAKGSKEFYKQIIYAQNPLMRTGLVLTGANRVWQGKPPVKGLDDGILTAYEISNLDLFKTDLAVLSACETGLGDINDSEGIFGLQRALKSAGVRQLLVSLWRIPDEETALLMKAFYQYYLEHNSAALALKMAQIDIQKDYSAFYWAGFVLIE